MPSTPLTPQHGIRTGIIVPREFYAWQRGFPRVPHEAAQVAEQFFDAALEFYFGATQEVVHVITGRLKGSGRIERMNLAGNTLNGAVAYGGAEYGVDYAGYENDRGGSHAYMDIGWEMAASKFDQAMPMTWAAVVKTWR